MKKQVWEKKRPKDLGKPKPFDKKSKKYKSAKDKADKKFGKKVSLVKNMFISKEMKKGQEMPNVNGKKFPYTAKGKKEAEKYAKKTGKKMKKKKK